MPTDLPGIAGDGRSQFPSLETRCTLSGAQSRGRRMPCCRCGISAMCLSHVWNVSEQSFECRCFGHVARVRIEQVLSPCFLTQLLCACSRALSHIEFRKHRARLGVMAREVCLKQGGRSAPRAQREDSVLWSCRPSMPSTSPPSVMLTGKSRRVDASRAAPCSGVPPAPGQLSLTASAMVWARSAGLQDPEHSPEHTSRGRALHSCCGHR